MKKLIKDVFGVLTKIERPRFVNYTGSPNTPLNNFGCFWTYSWKLNGFISFNEIAFKISKRQW